MRGKGRGRRESGRKGRFCGENGHFWSGGGWWRFWRYKLLIILFNIMSEKIDRPLVRYHGGKYMLADWIIGHFPEHRSYVESFGGGGGCSFKEEKIVC